MKSHIFPSSPAHPCRALGRPPAVRSRQGRKTVCRKSRRRPGFTMVELLVVISIIVVLAIIGFTAGRKVIDSASKARSMNNIKQLIALSQQFSTEQNGVILHWTNTKMVIGGVRAKRNWSHYLLLTMNPDLATNNDYMNSAGDAFAREAGIFADPKAMRHAKGGMPKSGHDSWRTYAYNNRIGVGNVDSSGQQIEYLNGAKHVNQVDVPNRLVLFSQRVLEGGGPYFSFLQPEDGSNGKIYFDLYNQSALVGFFDGHVESFTKTNYPSWGGISPRTGKAFTEAEMHEFWFGRAMPDS